MAAPKWHEGRITGFDTETSGTNPHDDRIVTASLVFVSPDRRPKALTWIIDPGVDIPDEAAQVHGWTTDKLRARVGGPGRAVRIMDGERDMAMTADGALFELAGHVSTAIHTETPLVAANAAFDLTLLEAELVRYGIDTIAARPDGVRGVVDPMVIDKQYDVYRKTCYKRSPDGQACDPENRVHVCGGCRGGKHPCGGCGATDRTLGSLCAHYGVFLGSAHEASADALAAARLAARLGKLWPDIGRLKLSTLHQKQVEWRRDQMLSLRAFFDRVGKEHDGCCPEWPVHQACATAGRAVA